MSLCRFESLVWFPNLIGFLIMLGVGVKKIEEVPLPPADAASILSYASIVVVYIIAWAPLAADYGVYHSAKTSKYVDTVKWSRYS